MSQSQMYSLICLTFNYETIFPSMQKRDQTERYYFRTDNNILFHVSKNVLALFFQNEIDTITISFPWHYSVYYFIETSNS